MYIVPRWRGKYFDLKIFSIGGVDEKTNRLVLAQECDATEDDKITIARNKIIILQFFIPFEIMCYFRPRIFETNNDKTSDS